MSILARYLIRLFLLRFAFFLSGITMFMLSLDLFENADQVMATRQTGIGGVAHYALLRLPEISSDVAELSYLLAAVFTMAYVAHHRELVAIWDAGISPLNLFARLLPVALLIGGLQCWVNDQIVPATASDLRSWDVNRRGVERVEVVNMATSAIWLRTGNEVVRVPRDAVGEGVLHRITIFGRDARGLLTERLDAGEARFENGSWRLIDVTRRDVRSKVTEHLAERSWPEGPNPGVFGRSPTHPKYLSNAELARLVSGAQQRYWASYLYSTWQQARFAGVLSPVVLIALLAALTQRAQHLVRVEYLIAGGIGLGFAFFIFSGVSLAMGEVGLLPPTIAAWAPPMCFLAVAGTVAVWHEGTWAPVKRSSERRA